MKNIIEKLGITPIRRLDASFSRESYFTYSFNNYEVRKVEDQRNRMFIHFIELLISSMNNLYNELEARYIRYKGEEWLQAYIRDAHREEIALIEEIADKPWEEIKELLS